MDASSPLTPRRQLSAAILDALAANGAEVAVADTHATTYRELGQRVEMWRAELRAMGFAPSSTLALRASYTAESVALALAVVLEGAAFCWLDPKSFVGTRLEQALRMLRPFVTATERSLANRMPDEWQSCSPRAVSGAPELEVRVHAASASASFADAAYILFTSGSTGQPKGVVISAQALFARMQHHRGVYALAPGDRLLSMTAIGTQVAYLFATLTSGASLHVLASKVLRMEIGDVLRSAAITGLFTTPTIWTIGSRGLKDGEKFFGETPSLRFINIGTGALPHSLLREVIARTDPHVAFHTGYGQSESGRVAFLANLHLPENLARVGCAGRALPGCGIFIARDRTALAEPGEVGEIIVTGQDLMRGYLGDDALTHEKLGTHGALGAATLLYTGDRGFLDAGGYLYFSGRTDTMIKVAGYRIYPREVEDVLAQHPGVLEAVVFGVPDPLRGGDQLAAVLVTKPGIEASDVRGFVAKQLARPFVPKDIQIWPELPRTSTGKPALAEIKTLYLRKRAEP